jgi:hypothetical protein
MWGEMQREVGEVGGVEVGVQEMLEKLPTVCR